METDTRRGDRWVARSAELRVNLWAIVAILAVLAGYGVAAFVAAVVRAEVELDDRAGLVLVGAVPSLGGVGFILGLVGRRRERLRWLSWIAIVLGALLVIGSLLAIGAVAIAFRSFS